MDLHADDLQSLYQYAMVLCQQASNAQDLLQSGIEILLSEKRKGKQINDSKSFVRRVIRNLFIDQCRKNQYWKTESYEEKSSYDISPINIEQQHIDQQELENVWSTLSPQDRDILYHWAILGYSTEEACEVLGVPKGTFLSRMHRLRKHYVSINEKEMKKIVEGINYESEA